MGLFDAGRKLQAETGFDDICEYRRDGISVGSHVPCKIGQSSMMIQTYGGATMHVHRMDFIIRSEDINVARPDVRDIIEHAGKRYAVCDTEGEKCWRWHDGSQKIYRIHSEEVDSEQVD